MKTQKFETMNESGLLNGFKMLSSRFLLFYVQFLEVDLLEINDCFDINRKSRKLSYWGFGG